MPRGCNSSVGRRMVRDRGVAEHPLSSGTCLQPASPELLLPQLALPAPESFSLGATSRAGRREDLAVLEGGGLVANPLCPQAEEAQLSTEGCREGSPLEGLPGARCAHRAVWVSEWNMLPNISSSRFLYSALPSSTDSS